MVSLPGAEGGEPLRGPDNPGLTVQSVEVGGQTRAWLRFQPAQHRPDHPCPLLLVLHGGGEHAGEMPGITEHGFERIAEQSDAVVVYPEAVDGNWRDDREGLGAAEASPRVDDVAFLRALIKAEHDTAAIDPERIYATGISSGALMCFRLAREAPELAAIAAVAGLLPVEAKAKPWSAPVSALVIQGTEDPLMPVQGGLLGSARLPRGAVLSLVDTMAFLVAQDRIDCQPQVSNAPPSSDITTWRCRQWRARDVAVADFEVVGGGHTWPCGRQYLPEAIIGRTSTSLDACGVIWDFFAKHPRAHERAAADP
jgi:polyhydroxybutyrate depolymerase